MKHLSLELLKCEHLNFDAHTIDQVEDQLVKSKYDEGCIFMFQGV